MKASLKKQGFVSAGDIKLQPRIIMSLCGMEKQGKTHFALTAPGPLAVFSTDTGEEGVINKFVEDKEILVLPIAKAEDDAVDEAKKEWEKFKFAFFAALRGDDFRSLIVDTATEIWELLRMARFGKLTQVMPYQYGPVNAEYRALIREAYSHDKNLILLHKMRATYVNDKRNGEWERAGFGDTGFLVQVNAEIYRYDISEGGEFCLWVKDCRQNADLAGEEFDGGMCDFPLVAEMIAPGAGE